MKQLLKSICLCVAVGMVMSCSIFKLYKKIAPFKYFRYLAPILVLKYIFYGTSILKTPPYLPFSTYRRQGANLPHQQSAHTTNPQLLLRF